MSKIINIDLDGVLNQYNGSYNPDEIPPIKDGAADFLKDLSKYYHIEIFTTREKELVRNWLIKNNIIDFIHDITNIKNCFASVFLDDRAINFNGDFQKASKEIQQFTPYWRK